MNFLSTLDLEYVKAHDERRMQRLKLRNVTRFYKMLLPAGNDMEVHTVAVKRTRTGQTVAKEVVRASVDDPFLYAIDIAYYGLGGYAVDWNAQRIRSVDFGYRGKWASEAFCDGRFNPDREVLNPEALLTHPRFRYCAWKPECGEITKFLKLYVKHPKLELLAKAGAWRFCSPGFVAAIARDRGLATFLMQHFAEIKRRHYGPKVVVRAYRRRIGLEESAVELEKIRYWHYWPLPKAVDRVKAYEYVNSCAIQPFTYMDYLTNAAKLGLNLRDTKVVFPRQFKQRCAVIADQARQLEIRQKAELLKKQDAEIQKAVARWAHLERGRAALRLLLPRRTEDFICEGKRLSNCLGDGHYVARVARGEAVVAFVRKADAPRKAFVAVEYDTKQKKVLQCYGAKNSRPPEQVQKFVEKAFARHRAA